MKNGIAVLITYCFLSWGCGGEQQPEKEQSAEPKSKSYFPVRNYLQGEINQVDSLPLKIVKYVTRGKLTDSSLIRTDSFNILAREFLVEELDSSQFEKNYKEESFFDKTTNSLTFTYSTRQANLSLQRVDVLATPSTLNDKVKSIYMERVVTRHDSLVVSKMYWLSGRSFQIISNLQMPGKAPSVQQLKVVWAGE